MLNRKNSLLISGTDTNVGKTVLTSSLVAYWQRYRNNQNLGLMKLLQTGVGDSELYHKLFDFNQFLEIITPIYLSTPVAPPIAADREGKTINLKIIWQNLQKLQQEKDFVLIEGIGGLGTPITHELTVADLARDWNLDVILVVPVKLGAIAQSVANVALARQSKVNVKGIVLSCIAPESTTNFEDWTPIDTITSFTNLPVLGVLPYLEESDNLEKLLAAADLLHLEKIF